MRSARLGPKPARRKGCAEREGFEPPIGLHLCRISSAVHSTTLPPLQAPSGDLVTAVGASSRRGRGDRQAAAAANSGSLCLVLPGLVPGIHGFFSMIAESETWMSPAMTTGVGGPKKTRRKGG